MNVRLNRQVGPRWQVWALVIGLIAASAAAGGWATAVILRPAEDLIEVADFTYVTVERGDVGSSLDLNAVAAWEPMPVGANRATGTVTSVAVAAGDEVEQGSLLYTVDLRPVSIAVGEVPAFRAIADGSHGADVSQLQSMLLSMGHYAGPIDGRARAATIEGVRAWQKSLGVEQTGVVDTADVIFVPSLPTRVSLDTDLIWRGANVSGGEQAVKTLSAAPVFTIPLAEAQAAMIPTGSVVEITAPDGTIWTAATGDQHRDEESQTVIVDLTGENGQLICAGACDLIPFTGEARLLSRIVTVPTVHGLIVPSSALTTDASNALMLIDEAGSRIPVNLVASARGMSVIEGAPEGLRVRVPAGAR